MLSLFRRQFAIRALAAPVASPIARFSTSAAAFEAAKKAKKTTKAPAKKAAPKKAPAKKAAPKKAAPKKETVKRAVIPFMFYIKEYYAKHGDELKPLAFADRTATIKRSWEGLTSHEREPYIEMYEKDVQRNAAEKAEAAKNAPPKRPTNSYLTWFNEERASLAASNPGSSIIELAKLAGEQWRSMSEYEKSHYSETQKAEMESWKAEYAKWKEARSL